MCVEGVCVEGVCVEGVHVEGVHVEGVCVKEGGCVCVVVHAVTLNTELVWEHSHTAHQQPNTKLQTIH